jgi:hypothetical protein
VSDALILTVPVLGRSEDRRVNLPNTVRLAADEVGG